MNCDIICDPISKNTNTSNKMLNCDNSMKSHNEKTLVIDTTLNAVVSDTLSRSCSQDDTPSQPDTYALAHIYNQGRWTQLEHLIFLA